MYIWEVNGCANHHEKHFSLVQSRIGEMTGTLLGALEQNEQKLNHRIHGFLGLGLHCGSCAFEFCLLGRKKQARNHQQEKPGNQGENLRCTDTMVLRGSQKTEPALSAGKRNGVLFIFIVLRETEICIHSLKIRRIVCR